MQNAIESVYIDADIARYMRDLCGSLRIRPDVAAGPSGMTIMDFYAIVRCEFDMFLCGFEMV